MVDGRVENSAPCSQFASLPKIMIILCVCKILNNQIVDKK